MSPKINLRVQHVTLSNSLIMSCSSSTVGFSPTDLWGFRQNSHKVDQNDDNDGFHDVISSHTRITMISLSEFADVEEQPEKRPELPGGEQALLVRQLVERVHELAHLQMTSLMIVVVMVMMVMVVMMVIMAMMAMIVMMTMMVMMVMIYIL